MSDLLDDPLLTPDEVADLLGIVRDRNRRLRRLQERGQLTPLRTPGNRRRYRESEVRALAARRDGAA